MIPGVEPPRLRGSDYGTVRGQRDSMISAARASLSASTTATESEYARPERCWRSHHPAQSGPRARTPPRSGQTLDGLGPKFNLKFKLKIASSESACRRRAKRTVGTQAVRAVLLITRDDIKCQGSEAQSQSVAAAASRCISSESGSFQVGARITKWPPC